MDNRTQPTIQPQPTMQPQQLNGIAEELIDCLNSLQSLFVSIEDRLFGGEGMTESCEKEQPPCCLQARIEIALRRIKALNGGFDKILARL